jgi:hypothetical protein
MSHDWPTTGASHEIGQHIVGCVDRFLDDPAANTKEWEDLKTRLLNWVQRLDPDVAFAGLLWILENQSRYQHQLVAGELLDRASLHSPIPLPELLHRIAPQFNLSAETVPQFLSHEFGRDAVVKGLREMREQSSVEHAGVRTMLYWLGERV